MSTKRIACGIAALAAAFAGPSLADTRMDYRLEGEDPVVESVLIGQGKLRVEQHGIGQWMLYDQAAQTIYYVNDARREYQQIDKASIRATMDRIAAATDYVDRTWKRMLGYWRDFDRRYPQLWQRAGTMRADMEKARRTLQEVKARYPKAYAAAVAEQGDFPDGQDMEKTVAFYEDLARKYESFERMFVGVSKEHYQGMLENTGRYSVVRAGMRQVAGYRCETNVVGLSMRVLPEPVKIMEYCSVPPSALGLRDADRAVVDGLRELTADLAQSTAAVPIVPAGIAAALGLPSKVDMGVAQLTLDALPVETRFYTGDRVTTTSTLASVSAIARPDPGAFRLPGGYRRVDPQPQLRRMLDRALEMEADAKALDIEG